MQFKIFNNEQEKGKVIILRLIKTIGTSGVNLVVCDKEGNTVSGGHLMNINNSGYQLDSGINLGFGFSLDSYGQLKERE